MQDATCLDFGCLNDEELNFMLQLDDDISSLVPDSYTFLTIPYSMTRSFS